jgi:hypothetical protein
MRLAPLVDALGQDPGSQLRAAVAVEYGTDARLVFVPIVRARIDQTYSLIVHDDGALKVSRQFVHELS